MTQPVLFLGLHLLGLAICLAWGPRRHPLVCSAFAFPVGLAAAAGLVLASLYIGTRLSITVVGGSCAIVAPALWVARGRWELGRPAVLVLAAGAAGLVAVAGFFTVFDATLFNYESHKLVLTAQAMGAEVTTLDVELFKLLSEGGPLVCAAYALAALGEPGFLHALQPTLLACVVAAAAAIAGRGASLLGAPRWARATAAGLAAVALVAHPGVLHTGLYVGGGSFAAAYVVCFVGVWWLAEVERDPSAVPVALLGLVALFAISEMTALLGLALLAVALFSSRLAERDLDRPMGVAAALLVAWLAAGGIDFPDTEVERYFSSGEAQALVGGVVAVYVVWIAARAGAARRWLRLLPPLLLAVGSAVTAIGVVAGLGGLDGAAASVWRGLGSWSWTGAWPVLLLLLGAGFLAGRMPGEWLLASTVAIAVLLVLWEGREAGFSAPPFGDLQLLATDAFAIALIYLLVKLAWIAGGAREDSGAVVQPSGSGRELGIAAVSLLAGVFLFNLHQADVREEYLRDHELAGIDDASIVGAARRGYGSRIARNQYAVYYMAAELTDGGKVRLPAKLMHHAPYLRHLAALEVVEGNASLPPDAAELLRPEIDQSWTFDLALRSFDSSGPPGGERDLHEIHFIVQPGVRDWILAVTPGTGPVFWMPLQLYLASGGVP